MMRIRLVWISFLFHFMISKGDAFVITNQNKFAVTPAKVHVTVLNNNIHDDDSNQLKPSKFTNLLGSAMIVSMAVLLNTVTASAVEILSSTTLSVESSTVQISEGIRVVDMSLPSYGSISDPKADTDSIKGKPLESSSSSSGRSSKKESATTTKKKEKKERKVVVASDKEDEKKTQGNVVIVDMSLPSYSDSTKGPQRSDFSL